MSVSSFVIHPAPELAPAEFITAFEHVVTPHISDNLQRISGITGLSRYNRKRRLLGTAFTVKTRPGDNLMIYKALTMLRPGHVLVVDGGGELKNALVGELIMRYAIERGCAGFVMDAAIRDTAAFLEFDFPCYARGVTHRGPYKSGPGAINIPVSVGGQVVQPGDIIVGDEDGVVSFPTSDAPRLVEAVTRTARNEDAVKAEIATGEPRQKWLDTVLAQNGL